MAPNPSTMFSNGETPNANDIVIALMGMTGSGKSSLISLCTDQQVEIGHDLQSCTQDIRTYTFCHPKLRSGRVYLVDTPGFDDTNRSDTEVLRTLAAWLTATYSSGLKLSGVLYLHRINQTRMQRSALKNIALFRSLCGDDALKKVVLVTTMWDITEHAIAESRERQLKETKDYWGSMVTKGSQVIRHNNTRQSAFDLIEIFMKGDSKIVLSIQSEMVDDHKPLERTEAGNDVKKLLAEQDANLRRDIQQVESELREALRKKDEELAEAMREVKLEHQQALQQVLENQQRLQVTIQQLHESKSAKLEYRLDEEMQKEKSQPSYHLPNEGSYTPTSDMTLYVSRDWPTTEEGYSRFPVRISPDGSCLVRGPFRLEHNVDLVSTETGRMIQLLYSGISDLRLLQFSPDGQAVASFARKEAGDPGLSLLIIRIGKPEPEIWYRGNRILSISTDFKTRIEEFYSNGSMKLALVSPANGNYQELAWETTAPDLYKEPADRYKEPSWPRYWTPIFVKQNQMSICYRAGHLYFWDLRDGRLLQTVDIVSIHQTDVRYAPTLDVSYNSFWVAVTTGYETENATSIFRLSGPLPELVRTIKHIIPSFYFSLSFDGTYLAVDRYTWVAIIEISTGSRRHVISQTVDYQMRFFPSDNRLILWKKDAYYVWNVDS